MVSSDAETLITDFGFATVGHFGLPPPSTQKVEAIPSMTNTAADAANAVTDDVPEITGVHVVEKRLRDGVSASACFQNAAADDNNGGQESIRPPGLNTNGGGENDGPDMASSDPGYNGPSSLGNRCDFVDGGTVMLAKGTPQAQKATHSFVPATKAAHAQRSCPAAGARVAPAASTTSAQVGTSANSTSSPPIGVGKSRRDDGYFRRATGGREALGSTLNVLDIGRPPNRGSVLYGTIKGYTPRYQSPEVSEIMEKKCKAAAAAAAAATKAGDRPSQTQDPQQVRSLCLLTWLHAVKHVGFAATSPAADGYSLRRPN